MKKIIYLAFAALVLTATPSCSDDEKSSSNPEYSDKYAEYNALKRQITQQEAKVNRLKDELKKLKGGAAIIKRDELDGEQIILERMYNKLRDLEDKLK